MPDSRPKAVEQGGALGVDIAMIDSIAKRITAETTPIWRCALTA